MQFKEKVFLYFNTLDAEMLELRLRRLIKTNEGFFYFSFPGSYLNSHDVHFKLIFIEDLSAMAKVGGRGEGFGIFKLLHWISFYTGRRTIGAENRKRSRLIFGRHEEWETRNNNEEG